MWKSLKDIVKRIGLESESVSRAPLPNLDNFCGRFDNSLRNIVYIFDAIWTRLSRLWWIWQQFVLALGVAHSRIPNSTILCWEDSVVFVHSIQLETDPFDVCITSRTTLYNGCVVTFRRVRFRQLLAQKIDYSSLWHYKMHLDIPAKKRQQWEPVLHRFVLGRKHN